MPHRMRPVFDDLKIGVANGLLGPFEVHIRFKPYLMQKYSKVITRYIKVCFAAILKRTFSNIPNISGGHGSRIGTSWCACRLHLHWRFGLFSARAGDRGGYLRPNLDMQRFPCKKYINVDIEDRLLIVDDYCVVYVVYVVFAFVRELGKIRMYIYIYLKQIFL